MGLIKKKIEELSNVNLEDFDIQILHKMQLEIREKKEVLLDELDKLYVSIKGADIYKEFYGDTKLLPKKFSTPLRRIISKQREIREIKKFNNRYDEEIERLENIIQRKTINEKQNKILNNSKFHKIKDIVIALLISVVLGLLIFESFNSKLSKDTLIAIFIIDAVCCLIFQINFFFELSLSPSKRWYLKKHWIDFITSIPVPNYEIVRGGRLFRLLRLLRILRFLRFLKIFKLLGIFWKGMDTLSEIFDIKLMKRTIGFSLFLMISGAFIIHFLEFKGGNGIETYRESLWWSFNAVVTGGFADIYNPETSAGMILTTLLVFSGMILIGVFTATLTTLMVGDDSNRSSDDLKLYVQTRLDKIEKKIEKMDLDK